MKPTLFDRYQFEAKMTLITMVIFSIAGNWAFVAAMGVLFWVHVVFHEFR